MQIKIEKILHNSVVKHDDYKVSFNFTLQDIILQVNSALEYLVIKINVKDLNGLKWENLLLLWYHRVNPKLY